MTKVGFITSEEQHFRQNYLYGKNMASKFKNTLHFDFHSKALTLEYLVYISYFLIMIPHP